MSIGNGAPAWPSVIVSNGGISPSDHNIFTVDTNTAAYIGWEQVRVGPLMETLPPEAWQRLSAGDGTKGPRL